MVEKIYRINKDLEIINDGLESVIYVKSTKKFVFLNKTANEIFGLIKKGIPIVEINHHMINKYNISPSHAKKSVEQTIKNLIENGLLIPEKR